MSSTVPVIDLKPWFAGDPAGRASVVDAVEQACSTYGFFQIVGHGIDPALVAAMLDANDTFFALPEDEKMALVRPPEVNRGYSPISAESLAYSLGVDAPPDLFEAFNVGRDVVDETDPAVIAERHRIFADNPWPDPPEPFRTAVVAYFDAVAELAREVTRIFATALDQPVEFFVDRCTHPTEVMRLLRYERQPGSPDPVEGQQRIGAHTDYGIVTVLYADPVPGLEIVGPDGAWWPVVPTDGAFVVNIGDMLAEWTNDRWRSTLHRVAPPPVGVDGPATRRSTAFFLDGDYDTLIECLPSCCSEANPARYEPILAGEHLIQKLNGSRGGLRPDTVDTVGERMGSVTAR